MKLIAVIASVLILLECVDHVAQGKSFVDVVKYLEQLNGYLTGSYQMHALTKKTADHNNEFASSSQTIPRDPDGHETREKVNALTIYMENIWGQSWNENVEEVCGKLKKDGKLCHIYVNVAGEKQDLYGDWMQGCRMHQEGDLTTRIWPSEESHHKRAMMYINAIGKEAQPTEPATLSKRISKKHLDEMISGVVASYTSDGITVPEKQQIAASCKKMQNEKPTCEKYVQAASRNNGYHIDAYEMWNAMCNLLA